MALSIPLSQTLPYYQQITTLSNLNYILTFKFNSREKAWYLDIANEDAVVILSSIKLLPGLDLMRKHKHKIPEGLFPNPLVLVRTNTPTDRPIALNNLGIDYELIYLEEGEF